MNIAREVDLRYLYDVDSCNDEKGNITNSWFHRSSYQVPTKNMPPKKDSKSVLITGGARGIGRCLVRTFVQKGHRVFFLDYDQEELTYTTTVHLTSRTFRLSYVQVSAIFAMLKTSDRK